MSREEAWEAQAQLLAEENGRLHREIKALKEQLADSVRHISDHDHRCNQHCYVRSHGR